MGYRDDLTPDDFDDLMAEAEGKPRKPKLTSYGPVNPHAAPIQVPAPNPHPVTYRPTAYPPVSPAPMTMQRWSTPVPTPVYYDPVDPMPRASMLIHGILLFTTGGIGNIFYQLYVIDKRNNWRRRHHM